MLTLQPWWMPPLILVLQPRRPHQPSRMKVAALFVSVLGGASAFIPSAPCSRRQEVRMAASRDWKKDVAKAAFVALPMIAPLIAGARIDYEGVPFLGGSDKIDINNANVRAYAQYQGMYPAVAGKIASHGPYKSVGDLYSISGLTDAERSIIKKYENKLVVLDPAPEYYIDRVNNGLYK